MAIKREQIIDNDVTINTKEYKYTIYDDSKGYLFKHRTNFIKGYQGIKLSDAVGSKSDYANMHLLAEHLYKDTNMISVYRNKKYQPATIKDMCASLDLSEKRFKQFMDRMMIIGLIAKLVINTNEAVQVQYHINPLYFNTSKYLSPMLYMMFRKQLDEHLPNWVIAKFNQK